MPNERIIEDIVRKWFEQFEDQIIIEEQQSKNLKIQKLLKNASKKGTGKGYPDFIITLKNRSELLIVIECKAEIENHNKAEEESKHYTSYISKEFDVIAISVSGDEKKHCINHFLQLKNEHQATDIFGDKLLPIEDYINGYIKSPIKFKQDYSELMIFTKKLNEELHSYKILESKRGLLISCILIALENPAFKTSYKSHRTSKDLSDALVQTVSNELKNANIEGEKLDNLNMQFSFIKTDTSLSNRKDILEKLIEDIDTHINQFIKTYEYIDILGELYIEFLRYANSDKGLGIVLTPLHIAELFSNIAQVNKDSIILDNCTGTGGFLITAMKKMILDAKGDQNKIRNIKTNQLFGIEFQAHIYALAISNMYIHQDGKTNIIQGDCFNKDIIEKIRVNKPTIGFLNPPYKANKKNDTEEL